MLEDHAQVKLDGMVIPLIGISKYGTIEECNDCHLEFGLQDIKITQDGRFLCCKCFELDSKFFENNK